MNGPEEYKRVDKLIQKTMSMSATHETSMEFLLEALTRAVQANTAVLVLLAQKHNKNIHEDTISGMANEWLNAVER